MRSSSSAALFIDKDGTLIENVPHNVDPGKVRFTRRAVAGLKLISAQGYAIVIVTNQPGLALGLFEPQALQRVERLVRRRLARHGVALAGFYVCPHAPTVSGQCGCRKPASGLLLNAARALNLDLKRSWMIGDILDDIEAGARVGCRTILLDVGNETLWQDGPLRRPHARVRTLWRAAHTILAKDRRSHAAHAR